jgi:hypothetical protein
VGYVLTMESILAPMRKNSCWASSFQANAVPTRLVEHLRLTQLLVLVACTGGKLKANADF